MTATAAKSTRAAAKSTRAAATAPRGLATEAELAEFLQLAPRTLTDWRWRGIGPRYIAINDRCVRYRWSDVEAWLDKQAQGENR